MERVLLLKYTKRPGGPGPPGGYRSPGASVMHTGYGPLNHHPRMQRGTLSPEADETSSSTVTLPQRARVSLSKQRERRAGRSTCADAFNVRSTSLSANMVSKSRNTFADALFTQGPMALVPPTIQ